MNTNSLFLTAQGEESHWTRERLAQRSGGYQGCAALSRSLPLGETKRSATPPSGWDSALGGGERELVVGKLVVSVVEVENRDREK